MDEKAIEGLLVELDGAIDDVFSLRASKVRKSDIQEIGIRLDDILRGMRNAMLRSGDHEQRPE